MSNTDVTHAYEIVGRRIWMTLPYGSPVKERIKSAGAHWDNASKRWWIGTVARDIVIPIMEEAMGTLDSAALVTVNIDLDNRAVDQTEHWGKQTVSIEGIPLIHRTGRDGDPRLAENVMLVSGFIKSRGGSMKYPYTEWADGTVIRVEVAEPVAQRWIEDGIATAA